MHRLGLRERSLLLHYAIIYRLHHAISKDFEVARGVCIVDVFHLAAEYLLLKALVLLALPPLDVLESLGRDRVLVIGRKSHLGHQHLLVLLEILHKVLVHAQLHLPVRRRLLLWCDHYFWDLSCLLSRSYWLLNFHFFWLSRKILLVLIDVVVLLFFVSTFFTHFSRIIESLINILYTLNF